MKKKVFWPLTYHQKQQEKFETHLVWLNCLQHHNEGTDSENMLQFSFFFLDETIFVILNHSSKVGVAEAWADYQMSIPTDFIWFLADTIKNNDDTGKQKLTRVLRIQQNITFSEKLKKACKQFSRIYWSSSTKQVLDSHILFGSKISIDLELLYDDQRKTSTF